MYIDVSYVFCDDSYSPRLFLSINSTSITDMQTFALYSIAETTGEQKVYYQLRYFCNLRTKVREYSLALFPEFNYL